MEESQPIKGQPVDYKEKFELQSINVTSRSYKEQLIDIDLQAIAEAVDNIAPSPSSYKVYTAVLSQSGTDNPLSIDKGLLTIGVTYMIATSFTGDDFSNVGGPEITFDDEGIGTYFIATGTTPAKWTNKTGFEYNTGSPVVTVLENTLGDIYWTYDSTGFYTGHSARLFTENKSFALISSSTMGAIVTNISVYDTSNALIVASDSKGYRENFIAYVEIRVYKTK